MSLSSSIFFTLAYADIFQYPYTSDELEGWIPKNIWGKKAIWEQIQSLRRKKIIAFHAPFFVLYGHTKNIQIRLNREQKAVSKREKAHNAARILRAIPTIMFVGITGGLSIQNADEEDDIDFYICTKKGTLWITRFFSTLLMELFGIRRRPGMRNVKNTICLNMFVSDDALAVPHNQRDIYTAHEVLQMEPVWDRKGIYVSFLKKNRWVSSVFFGKWKDAVQRYQKTHVHPHEHLFTQVVVKFFKILEKPAKGIQLWYMQKRRTSEVVSDTIIRFHPHDARFRIRRLLRFRLKRYHLPLDKNFFQT